MASKEDVVSPTPTMYSSLDQIRQAEAEVARRVAATRESAGRKVAQTRRDAALLKTQAQEVGRQKGQAQYREIIARTEEEVSAMIAQAQLQADQMRLKGRQRLTAAVQGAIQILVDLPLTRTSPDSKE